MFEHLVQDVSSRTGLGPVPATDLVRAVTARLLHNSHGGFAPLLANLRDGGKADLVTHWLGDDPKAGTISPDEAETILGADYVDETSRALGISRDEVRIGSAVALPSIVHELTPGGMVPAADELERGYAGWAGGHVSVGEAPIAGFPTEPSPLHTDRRVEMDLQRPAPEIKAKARDGIMTLAPWALIFVALPILSVVTCNMYPAQTGGHGAAHAAEGHGGNSHDGAATGAGHTSPHEEPGGNEHDSPTRQPGRETPETHGSTNPGAGDAASGNTAAPGTPQAPPQGESGEHTGEGTSSPSPNDQPFGDRGTGNQHEGAANDATSTGAAGNAPASNTP